MSEATPDEKVQETASTPTETDTIPKSSHLGRGAIRQWAIVILATSLAMVIYRRQVILAVRKVAATYYADTASEALLANDDRRASGAVARALGWLPDDASLVYLRAQIHAQQEEWTESLAEFDRLIQELTPDFSSAYAGRAAVYHHLGDYSRALDDAKRAVDLAPANRHDLLNYRAYLRALANEELPNALDDIELAMNLFTDQAQRLSLEQTQSAAYLDTRGFIHFRIGNFDAALNDLELALERLDENQARERKSLEWKAILVAAAMHRFDEMRGEIIYHRGQVLEARGEMDAAETDFARAAELGFQPPGQFESSDR